MDNYILLAYLASAVLAIVIYVSKSRRQRDLEAQNEDLREKYAVELAFIKSQQEGQVAELTKKIDDTDEAKLLRNQLASLRDQLAQATETLQQAEVAKKWLAAKPQLEAERMEMETALARIAGDVVEKTRKAAELTQRVGTLAAEVAKMESERALLTDELASLHKGCDDARGMAMDLQRQIEEAKRQLKLLHEDIRVLETQKRQLDIDIGLLTETKKEIERKIEQLEKLRKDCEPKALEYEAKAKALGSLEDALKSTTDLQKSIASTNKLMMDDLAVIAEARKKGQVVLRQAAFEGLVMNAPFSKPAGNRNVVSEATALEGLKRYVREDRQYDLPDRLLYAFHASLKTSDISSLTVMAGVSGTGKSALPDLYAKAMGFHLVTLAVEPRWDSPKDLLGFFNYVTNRYEPTPLARALFQFQGYHQETAMHPDPDLKNYMLMAMLDEMNLARIEYYFSEFLSKLESRRRGEMSLAEHRREIALEIFAGASGTERVANGAPQHLFTEPPIRLFADDNTLFVGTMNEDETTQSLSDKVLDRANVLYFGRPGNLKPKTADAGSGAEGMLLRTTWKGWCKSVAEADVQVNGRFHEAGKLLSEMNSHLASLGRPFAHRSYQAMLAYLANYPYAAAGLDEVKRPLADQIGMRIMPKLRGLDLAQHAQTLEQVGTIVTRVGDETLSEAFRRATSRQENRSGFFHWQGLDWAHEEQ